MTNQSFTTVFELEMRDRSAFRAAPFHPDFSAVLIDPPNPDINREFYLSVGAPWQWTDRLDWSAEGWKKHVHRDALKTFLGQLNGKNIGYFELEAQSHGNIEILYFGLLPDYIGKGLGASLLTAAILNAWEFPNAKRVWLHTCNHDHKHALGNYLSRGFELYKSEQKALSKAPNDPD